MDRKKTLWVLREFITDPSTKCITIENTNMVEFLPKGQTQESRLATCVRKVVRQLWQSQEKSGKSNPGKSFVNFGNLS